MNGNPDGSFGIDMPVTRAEVVSLLYRYKAVEGTEPNNILSLTEMREVGRTGTNIVTIGKVTYVEGSKRFEDIREVPLKINIGSITPHFYLVLDTFNTKPKSVYFKVFDRGQHTQGYTAITKVTFTPSLILSSLQTYCNALTSITGSSMIRLKATTVYGAEGLENTFGGSDAKYNNISEYLKKDIPRTFWNSTSGPVDYFTDIGKSSFKLNK